MLNYATNPFVVNNWSQPSSTDTVSILTNTVQSLQNDVRNLKAMVAYDSKTVKADNVASYTAGSAINILSPMSFSNVALTVNGYTVTGGVNSLENYSTIMSLDQTFSTITSLDATFSTMTSLDATFSTITVSNDITYGGNLIHTSDARLKQNIRPYTFDSDAVLAGLNPVRFMWSDGREDIGLLAQDVQAVVPECVSVGSDGNLGVDYAKLVVVLLKILREKILH